MKNENQHARLVGSFLEHYVAHGSEVRPSVSLLHPLMPTTFVFSPGIAELARLTTDAKEDTTNFHLLQPCFREFDLKKLHGGRHLGFFHAGAAFHFEVRKNDFVAVSRTLLSFLRKEIQLREGQLTVALSSEDEMGKQMWSEAGLDNNSFNFVSRDQTLWTPPPSAPPFVRQLAGTSYEVFCALPCVQCSNVDCRPGCSCQKHVEIANVIIFRSPSGQPWAAETVVGMERALMIQQNLASILQLPSLMELRERLITKCECSPVICENSGFEQTVIATELFRGLSALLRAGAEPGPKGRGNTVRRIFKHVCATVRACEGDITKLSELLDEVPNATWPVPPASPRLRVNFLREFDLFEKTELLFAT
jgi:alanyl-tRNA synthetase